MVSKLPLGDLSVIDYPFANQTVAFTGKLSSLARKEARALVERMGGSVVDQVTTSTTMLVVGDQGFAKNENTAVDISEIDKSNKLRKAEEVNARSPGSVYILREQDFCRLSGLSTSEHLEQQLYNLRDIRNVYSTVREDHFRCLEKWGLIRSVVRTNIHTYYNFQDLLVVKQVSIELNQGSPFRAVLRRLLAAREGQLSLDFRPMRRESPLAKVVELPHLQASVGDVVDTSRSLPSVPAARVALAVRHFCEAAELDEGDEFQRQQAATAYRAALVLDPDLVPALVNLANLHYALDELVEAQALYERALGIEADCFEAHFNLGNLHHDLCRYDEAIQYYRDALKLNSDYAEAHFYMAVTLEKLGQSKNARPHWHAYQKLVPDGEWADLARELSEQ